MTQKSIDIRKGDQFGYMNSSFALTQERNGQYRYMSCYENDTGAFWNPIESQVFRPVPDSVARAVLAATGYTVVEVQEEKRVEWPTHAVQFANAPAGTFPWVGSESALQDLAELKLWTGFQIVKLPDPPPHPTLVELAKALAVYFGRIATAKGSLEDEVNTAAQAVIDAGGKQ